jgi:hypothetical protein
MNMNQPQTLEQFNKFNEQVFIQNTVGSLTNWRKLGNKYNKKSVEIMNGYYKLHLFIDKMLVKSRVG